MCICRGRRLKNPSATRNCQPILDVLVKTLDRVTNGLKLLEISSGVGQHVAFFAPHFPNITFYPSEYDTRLLDSILSYKETANNIMPPLCIDIREPYEKWQWNAKESDNANINRSKTFDCILNFNMIHITPWQCTEGLFRNAAGLLKANGLVITYGPYAVDGVLTPDSNRNFDQHLRQQNPEWGVRDIRNIERLANEFNIRLKQIHEMPANNKICIWTKCDG